MINVRRDPRINRGTDQGQVLYWDSTLKKWTYTENSELYWNDTNKRLETKEIRAIDSNGLKLYDDGGNGIFVEDGGNVGIGTTSPAYKLDVQGGVAMDALYFYEDQDHAIPNIKEAYTLGSNTGLTVNIGTGRPNYFRIQEDGSAARFVVAQDNSVSDAGDIMFYSGPDDGNNEIMRLKGDGNVGIGTTDPDSLLHLAAGTATVAPLKFTTGTCLSTPEAGAMEYCGTRLEFTPQNDRRSVDLSDGAVTADTTVADTTTETTIYTQAISADELYEGLMVHAKIIGHYDTSSASDFFTARLKVGGTTIETLVSSAANITDGYFDIEFNFTVRSTGSTGSIIASAKGNFDGENVQTASQSADTIDTTTAEDITVTIQWDAADAGNSLTITQGITNFKN